ncbi:hypothetical protein GGR56DRAFT_645263 [Xylariaceae sp. FL0804]|nr:hypothetical protein GGR56DRAFT_645263 [Xylariaceae sp. FL0804]
MKFLSWTAPLLLPIAAVMGRPMVPDQPGNIAKPRDVEPTAKAEIRSPAKVPGNFSSDAPEDEDELAKRSGGGSSGGSCCVM